MGHGRTIQLSRSAESGTRRCGPQPALELASAGPIALQNGAVADAPQLVFELGSAATTVVGDGVRLASRLPGRGPPLAHVRALAAVQNFALVEGVHQRSAPLQTVTRHLSAPFARLAAAAGAAVEQSPLEARRFVAGAVAGALFLCMIHRIWRSSMSALAPVHLQSCKL